MKHKPKAFAHIERFVRPTCASGPLTVIDNGLLTCNNVNPSSVEELVESRYAFMDCPMRVLRFAETYLAETYHSLDDNPWGLH